MQISNCITRSLRCLAYLFFLNGCVAAQNSIPNITRQLLEYDGQLVTFRGLVIVERKAESGYGGLFEECDFADNSSSIFFLSEEEFDEMAASARLMGEKEFQAWLAEPKPLTLQFRYQKPGGIDEQHIRLVNNTCAAITGHISSDVYDEIMMSDEVIGFVDVTEMRPIE